MIARTLLFFSSVGILLCAYCLEGEDGDDGDKAVLKALVELAYSKSFRMLGTGSCPPLHTFLYCNIDIHQEYQQNQIANVVNRCRKQFKLKLYTSYVMTRVFFVESFRVNNITVFSSSIQCIHRKHSFNNQFNFIKFVFV